MKNNDAFNEFRDSHPRYRMQADRIQKMGKWKKENPAKIEALKPMREQQVKDARVAEIVEFGQKKRGRISVPVDDEINQLKEQLAEAADIGIERIVLQEVEKRLFDSWQKSQEAIGTAAQQTEAVATAIKSFDAAIEKQKEAQELSIAFEAIEKEVSQDLIMPDLLSPDGPNPNGRDEFSKRLNVWKELIAEAEEKQNQYQADAQRKADGKPTAKQEAAMEAQEKEKYLVAHRAAVSAYRQTGEGQTLCHRAEDLNDAMDETGDVDELESLRNEMLETVRELHRRADERYGLEYNEKVLNF